jgi:hypothetical protein
MLLPTWINAEGGTVALAGRDGTVQVDYIAGTGIDDNRSY